MKEETITGRAYQILRTELISCRLAPGSQLNISALQNRLSLSQASVREALSRLSAEGLVDNERHRGFRVTKVSASGFRELTQALLTIELPCLRSSIINGDVEWELNLVARYHRSLRTLELVVAGEEDLDAYSRERLAFYDALLAACDNSWLLWSWRLLYVQNARYRHMYMPLAKFELELNPEHEEIMKHVLARDADKAVALSIESYARVTRFIEDRMASEKEPKRPARAQPKAGRAKPPKPRGGTNPKGPTAASG